MLWDFLLKQREFVWRQLIMMNSLDSTVDIRAGLNEFDAELGNILDCAHIITQPPSNHKIWNYYNPTLAIDKWNELSLAEQKVILEAAKQ